MRVRQAAWRLGATGLERRAARRGQFGAHALDDRLRLGGRLAAVPLAVPVGLGVAYVVDRLRAGEHADRPTPRTPPPALSSARRRRRAWSAASPASPTASTPSPTSLARRLAAVLPGPPELWRLAGHAGFLVGLGVGASALWHRAMRRIEAMTSAEVPVIEPGEDSGGLPSTVSGGPGSLVSWAGMGRDGRLHALASVRPQPLPDRPDGVPDLSIETVMGTPARATPVQVYVGLDNAPTARERVDLAMAELERTGALDRSLLVLVSPTGTGYVNYVAVAALQYLALGDVATVTLQYSRRPSPLSLGMIRAAGSRTGCSGCGSSSASASGLVRRPRVVLFGESLGAHTSQDVFLHWGTLGLDAMGIDRALWIGTPYGSKWMRQVTRGERLDVDRDAVAVVNDRAQLAAADRAARLPAALRPAEPRQRRRDEVRPRPALVPPGLAGSRPAAPEPVAAGSPRGIPPAMRWRPVTTFFQSLVDMKNAQTAGPTGRGSTTTARTCPASSARCTGCPGGQVRRRPHSEEPAHGPSPAPTAAG